MAEKRAQEAFERLAAALGAMAAGETENKAAAIEAYLAEHADAIPAIRARQMLDKLRRRIADRPADYDGAWAADWKYEGRQCEEGGAKKGQFNGLANAWMTQPLEQEKPAKWSRSAALDGSRHHYLRMEVSAHPERDWVLIVMVNGKEALNRVVDATAWQLAEVDLSSFAGQEVRLELWNKAGGAEAWNDEFGYWDFVRIDSFGPVAAVGKPEAGKDVGTTERPGPNEARPDVSAAYASFLDGLYAALRKGEAREAAQILSRAEKDPTLSSLEDSLALDRRVLSWIGDLDRAAEDGAEKLKEMPSFELRLKQGNPIRVGREARFQVIEVKERAIQVGGGGISMPVPFEKLTMDTRFELAALATGGDAKGLTRRAFVALLSADGRTEAASLHAMRAATDKARSAGAHREDLDCLDRLAGAAARFAADGVASAAWDRIVKMAEGEDAEGLRKAVADFQAAHGGTRFAQTVNDARNLPAKVAKAVSQSLGLVAYWPFDESSGDRAEDFSGNGIQAIVRGAARAPGRKGNALLFDGKASHLAIPDRLIHSRKAVTFAVWFKTKSGGVILGYQDKTHPDAPGQHVPILYVGTDGKLRGELWCAKVEPVTSEAVVNDDKWHHAALAAGASGQVLYLDGKSIGRLSGDIQHLDMFFNQIGKGYSGNWPGGNGGWHFFDGLLDEARFYERAVSADEVAGLAGVGKSSRQD